MSLCIRKYEQMTLNGALVVIFATLRRLINCRTIVIRPRRSQSAAACSHQTFPVDDLSVGPSVVLSVQCIVEKRQIGSGCRLAS